MTDIVERLRARKEPTIEVDMHYPQIVDSDTPDDECIEAAAEIERLRAALRPFACKCSVKGMGAGGNCTRGSGECDCWNARAALEERT